MEQQFAVGDKVLHSSFGVGTVICEPSDVAKTNYADVTVKFRYWGEREVADNSLTLAPPDQFAIVDFETTGLNYPVGSDQIIEVAVLRTDLQKDYGSMQFFVGLKENMALSDFIKQYTGVTESDLEQGVTYGYAMHLLQTFCATSIFVAHNFPFEESFLHASGVLSPRHFICTRTLVKLIEPDKSASLKDIADRLGIPNPSHHRAMNDVLVTKEILKHYLPLAEQAGLDYYNVILEDKKRPLRHVPANARIISK